jgi:tetratricopeptide (TPR) repeat protein
MRVAAALLLIAAIAGVYLWSIPVERPRVVIAPFGNQTGDSGLDEYRLALTQTLALALRDSANVAVTPYARVLEPLGRFVDANADVSSREAVTAVAASTGAAHVLVPTLLRDGGEWRARVELRDRATTTTAWVFETPAEKTALSRAAAYSLTLALADAIDDHFTTRPAWLKQAIRRVFGSLRGVVVPHVQSLEAAKAFEEGSRWYEHLEFASARRAFELAVQQDPRNPLALAWLSRAAQLTRDNEQAIEVADQSTSRLTDQTPRTDALFVRAVAAEAKRDVVAAEEAYRTLTAESPDASWSLELGGFLDRRDRNADAAVAYHQALERDPQLVRPRLELCRLYSPSRLNEPVEAKKNGEAALASYRSLARGPDGPRPSGGEGQSLMCLADTLRVGSVADRAQAQEHAETARSIFGSLGFSYNRARAEYYVAFLAAVRGNLAQAVPLGERALQSAQSAGNAAIRPLILNNLGVVHVSLGNRPAAASYYREASALYQAWHEESRAAQILANRGAMLIEGGSPEEGILDVKNALALTEKLGDKAFQAFCSRVIATYLRNQGRHREAQAELNKGMAIASERSLIESITLMRTHFAISQFETGEYHAARLSLLQALKDGTGRVSTEARIRLARADLRLGDVHAAQEGLRSADLEIQQSPNRSLRALLLLVQGEWASEAAPPPDARHYFEEASRLWSDAAPDPSTIEARARLGLILAREGRIEAGSRLIRESLDAARRLAHLGLEARCRTLLAHVELIRGRLDEATMVLEGIPSDDGVRTVGPELRAEAYSLSSRIRASRGDVKGSALDAASARLQIETIAQSLPEPFKSSFYRRPGLKTLSQTPPVR